TRSAERIGADDLSQRLRLRLPDDELGRLARAFDAMIDRLDRAFRRQREFVADTSHELRNPLTVIRGNLGLLRQDLDYESRMVAVLEAEAEAARMSRLVDHLLLLARADASQELERGPVRLEALI